MNSQQVATWAQVITGIAVLIGLGLVVWELTQARALARAQLTSESYTVAIQTTTSLLGEDPLAAVAKACDRPNELTTQDTLVLKRYYEGLLGRAMVLRTIAERDELLDRDYWREILFTNVFP